MNAWLIFAYDFKRCFAFERLPILIAAALLGVWLALQPGDLSPLIAVAIVGFAAMEMQFDNILYRSPSEFEALTLFVVPWRAIILAKNLATIAASGAVMGLLTAFVLYFPLHPPTIQQIADGFLYWLTLVFPLLSLGNIRSVQEPRRSTEGHGDNLAQGAGMLFFIFLMSIPYVIIHTLLQLPWGCVLYGIVMAMIWYHVSIPRTAAAVIQRTSQICAES